MGRTSLKARFMAAAMALVMACQADQLVAAQNEVEELATSRTEQALTGENSGGENMGALNLGGANLGGANLGGANLGGANLGGANLGGANLGGPNLGGANLGGANLGGANLGGANLGGANLGGANLGGANLSATNLGGANLGGANLGGANLGGANLAATMLNGSAPGNSNPYLSKGNTYNAMGLTQQGQPYGTLVDVTQGGVGINIHQLSTLPVSNPSPGPSVEELLDLVPGNSIGLAGSSGIAAVTSVPARTDLAGFMTTGGSTAVIQSGSITITTGATTSSGRYVQQIRIYAVRGPARGKLNVLIDGVLRGTIDEYNAVQQNRSLVWQYSFFSGSAHTITLTAAGTKSASSTSTQVDVDAIGFVAQGPYVATWSGPTQMVPGQPILVPTEAVAATNVLRAGTTSRYTVQALGSQQASSVASGGTSCNGQVTYTDDRMPNIRIYSVKGPNRGRVDVRIDNVVVATGIDLYAPSLTRALIYSGNTTPIVGTSLPDRHSVRVMPTSVYPFQNPLATGNLVDVDSFEVVTPGPDVEAPQFPSGSMLMSGEDLYNQSFAAGGQNAGGTNDACIVMGLGSTAFAELVTDNVNGYSSPFATVNMVAMVGKLPWGFSETANGPKSLDSWEVIVAGPNRYCVFVVQAPSNATYDGVVGYIKSVFRWNASPTSTIRIGAIGGGQTPKVYSGMMNAAAYLQQGQISAKVHVGGQLAFTTATTNNVSVNVDFSSWVSLSYGQNMLLGRVAGAPAYFEGGYFAYETSSGAIGVALVPGVEALPNMSSVPQMDGSARLQPWTSSTPLNVKDAAVQVVNAYTNWLQYGGGGCHALGSGACTPTNPPAIKRCAGAKAVARSEAYQQILRNSPCFPGNSGCTDSAIRDSILNIGVDPVLGAIMKTKCDSIVITDSSGSGEVNATLFGGSSAIVKVNRQVFPQSNGGMPYVAPGYGTSSTNYTYADDTPTAFQINSTFDREVMINGYRTWADYQQVNILAGTYVHLNEAPF